MSKNILKLKPGDRVRYKYRHPDAPYFGVLIRPMRPNGKDDWLVKWDPPANASSAAECNLELVGRETNNA